MTEQKKSLPHYWQSLAARDGDPAALESAGREFQEELPIGSDGKLVQLGKETSRRDFFSLMGLSAAAAGLAACQKAPVTKLIPYLNKPEEVVPGVANWYASACAGCSARCGVLLKSRDGRPIKVEGNPEHPWSKGAVCAIGQATVLSLYDAARGRAPASAGAPTTWAALDAAVAAGLKKAAAAGQAVRVLAPPTLGPTGEQALARFLAAHANARAVRFDSTGEVESLADAVQAAYGVRALPDYKLDQAQAIASFDADFLGTWIAPAAYARLFADGRALPLAPRAEEQAAAGHEAPAHGGAPAHGEPKGHGAAAHAAVKPPKVERFNRLWVLEPALSLTGANADKRAALAPSETVAALAALVRRLAAGSASPAKDELLALCPKLPEPALPKGFLDALAADLKAAGPKALVLSGGSDPAAHALALAANELLGAAGTTCDVAGGQRLDEKALAFGAFVDELKAGKVGALVTVGVNPLYAHPDGAQLGELFAKLPLFAAISDRADETARLAQHLATEHSAYESWCDAEPRRGLFTLGQPALNPLFDTRARTESLLAWAGAPQAQYDTLKERWRTEVFPRAKAAGGAFEAFWQRAVHDGFAEVAPDAPAPKLAPAGLAPLLKEAAAPAAGIELALVQKVALRDGAHANNAWLQELPDPITKNTWENLAMVAPSRAAALGLKDGDLVSLSAGGRSLVLPVLAQPGVHPRVVAVALGYGRTDAGAVSANLGVRAVSLARADRGRVALWRADLAVAPTGAHKDLALSQTHASLEGRPHVKEATLGAFLADAGVNNPPDETPGSLWGGHQYPGHRWGMAVDLSRCNGCSACLVSCQAENNVAVVGRSEIARSREMHWIRLDRYYAGDPEAPEVLFQPMMCQHCTNAPCETVCPVLATNHSSEGLNQQVYNRCVGTRYCANNCPPKVRRFNWFENRHDDEIERLVLNPDVVVRGRGVMEKCSLCVQRIGQGKAEAKRAGRDLKDGEIQTACQQSCPAQAIVFGDLNDPKSRAALLAADARAYRVLPDLNIGPVISYLTKVKNPGSAS